MRYISETEATRCFSKLIDLVREGETIVVVSRGQAVATLAPAAPLTPHRERSKAALLERLRQQPALGIRWSREDLYDQR